MARTSRQQRRQRRAQVTGAPPLQPARKQQPVEVVRESAIESAEPQAERPSEVRRSGIPGVTFLREAIAELKKVEWPNQQKVVSGTAVVLVACVIVGVYLYANDQVWKYVVQHLLLR